jgi:hypothetical protein
MIRRNPLTYLVVQPLDEVMAQLRVFAPQDSMIAVSGCPQLEANVWAKVVAILLELADDLRHGHMFFNGKTGSHLK